MSKTSSHSFVTAMKAEGVGNNIDTEYPEKDHHCPQLGTQGMNMYKSSCEERRREWLSDNSPCRKYPNCQPVEDQEAPRQNQRHKTQTIKDHLKK